jgi:tRNA-modifying protein YgfZ
MSDAGHPPATPRVPLDRAELIEIAGADALAFAHAQFSSDVAGLATGGWQYSAWLTAEGRTRAVFALLRVADDRLLAWLPLGGARAIADALARYVLRAKVRLAVLEWTLCKADAAPGGDGVVELDGGYAFALKDSRTAWLGPGFHAKADPGELLEWRLADIAAGLPWLAPDLQDKFLPQALELGRIDALRLDKGCFPGQEIAARLHFRGGIKQRLHRVILRGAGDVCAGLAIDSGGVGAGVVLYAALSGAQAWQALAIINDAATGSAQPMTTNAHNVLLHSGHFI